MGRGVATLGSEDGNLEAETPLGGSPCPPPHSRPLTLPNTQFTPEEEKAAHSPGQPCNWVASGSDLAEQLGRVPVTLYSTFDLSILRIRPEYRIRIRFRRSRIFLSLLDTEPDLLVPDASFICKDPDPSINKQKTEEKP